MKSATRQRHSLEPVGWFALALGIRALVAARTAMPERDAAHYLWMADGIALGEPGRLLDSVFHPVFPAIVGGLRALLPGVDPVVAIQSVACIASALAVFPLWHLARRLDLASARLALAAFAIGTWFVRHPADGLSEGLFHLSVAGSATLLLADGRLPTRALAGVAAALAFGTRPEGALSALVAVAWLAQTAGARAVLHYALGLSSALLLPLAWSLANGALVLTPKASFVWTDGVGSEGLYHWFAHFPRAVAAIPEALGYGMGPLAVFGALSCMRTGSESRRIAVLLALPFALQLLVIPVLRSHHRFLSGFGILMLPFAKVAITTLAARVGLRSRAILAGVLLVAFAGDLLRLPSYRRADRVVERRLGEWLRTRHVHDGQLVSDLQRADYFAGVRPAPPRRITAEEMERVADHAAVRFVVYSGPHGDRLAARLADSLFRPAELPVALRDELSERGTLVLQRD
ncbi:MAG: hypothetical protein AB7T19_05005 [Planctomycetota bacterium]